MRTRDVLCWNFAALDLVKLAMAGAALVLLEHATRAVERWLDGRV